MTRFQNWPDDLKSWRLYCYLELWLTVFLLIIPVLLRSEEHRGWFELKPCPVLASTGIPCATCGITRSIHALYQGDVNHSIHYHPFGLWIVIGLVVHAAYRITALHLQSRHFRPWFIWADLTFWMLVVIGFRIGIGFYNSHRAIESQSIRSSVRITNNLGKGIG